MSRLLLALVALPAACSKPVDPPAPAPVAAPTGRAPLPGFNVRMPARFPASNDPARFVGAAACGECHAAALRAWSSSPHAHAMARPTPASVLAPFDGHAVKLADGVVTPARHGDAYSMEMKSGAVTESYPVELVLASGRQHQLYLTRLTNSWTFLPIYFATRSREWVGNSYWGDHLDPQAPEYWKQQGVGSIHLCPRCHLSQGSYVAAAAGPTLEWVDLSINCESCHGAGAEHARQRRAGTAEPYSDLHRLNQDEEGRLCGRCHALSVSISDIPTFATLAMDVFRPDGTQMNTSYQYAGHAASACYRKGALTCSACHNPHTQKPQDLTGESAVGAASNRQCVVCHRNQLTPAARTAHSRHRPSAGVRCIDCHMPKNWIMDSPATRQQVSDHSISIPRPRESEEFHTGNACTGCHRGRTVAWATESLKKWGATQALDKRPWVETIAAARRRDGSARDALIELIRTTPSTYLRQSALEAASQQPPAPEYRAAVQPFVSDPDPSTRAFALLALVVHDPARASDWVRLGLADPSPKVREMIFPAARDPQSLKDDEIARTVDDLLAHSILPPIRELAAVAGILVKRGQYGDAMALIDAARPWALPQQAKELDSIYRRASSRAFAR